MRYLLLLGLAGCFDPHPVQHAPCSAVGDLCPAGQMCIAGFCDGPPDLTDAGTRDSADGPTLTPDDRDGDGVPNASDNCPDKANPDQGDEDGDRLGDACDPCPVDASTADPDADGVAGICDPHPNDPGDKIAAFQGFHGALPGDWRVVGSVTQGGDAMAITTPNKTHAAIVAPMALTNGMVMTGVTIDQTTGDFEAEISATIPYDPEQDQGIVCSLYSPRAASTNNRTISLFDVLANKEAGFTSFGWQTATAYRIAMTRKDNAYTCVAGTDGNLKTVTGTTASVPTVSKAGMAAFGANLRVAWLLVVTSP